MRTRKLSKVIGVLSPLLFATVFSVHAKSPSLVSESSIGRSLAVDDEETMPIALDSASLSINQIIDDSTEHTDDSEEVRTAETLGPESVEKRIPYINPELSFLDFEKENFPEVSILDSQENTEGGTDEEKISNESNSVAAIQESSDIPSLDIDSENGDSIAAIQESNDIPSLDIDSENGDSVAAIQNSSDSSSLVESSEDNSLLLAADENGDESMDQSDDKFSIFIPKINSDDMSNQDSNQPVASENSVSEQTDRVPSASSEEDLTSTKEKIQEKLEKNEKEIDELLETAKKQNVLDEQLDRLSNIQILKDTLSDIKTEISSVDDAKIKKELLSKLKLVKEKLNGAKEEIKDLIASIGGEEVKDTEEAQEDEQAETESDNDSIIADLQSSFDQNWKNQNKAYCSLRSEVSSLKSEMEDLKNSITNNMNQNYMSAMMPFLLNSLANSAGQQAGITRGFDGTLARMLLANSNNGAGALGLQYNSLTDLFKNNTLSPINYTVNNYIGRQGIYSGDVTQNSPFMYDPQRSMFSGHNNPTNNWDPAQFMQSPFAFNSSQRPFAFNFGNSTNNAPRFEQMNRFNLDG